MRLSWEDLSARAAAGHLRAAWREFSTQADTRPDPRHFPGVYLASFLAGEASPPVHLLASDLEEIDKEELVRRVKMAVKAGAGPLIGRGKDPERYSDDELRSHLRSNRFILAPHGAASGQAEMGDAGEDGRAKGGGKAGGKGGKGGKGHWKGGGKERREAPGLPIGGSRGEKRSRAPEADAPAKRGWPGDVAAESDYEEAEADAPAEHERSGGEAEPEAEEAGAEEEADEEQHQPWHLDEEAALLEPRQEGGEAEGLPQQGGAEFWEDDGEEVLGESAEGWEDGAVEEEMPLEQATAFASEDYAFAEAHEQSGSMEGHDRYEDVPEAEPWYGDDAMAAGAGAEEWHGGDAEGVGATIEEWHGGDAEAVGAAAQEWHGRGVEAPGAAAEEWYGGEPSESVHTEDASLIDDSTALDRIMAE